MKITKRQLRRIIREEKNRILCEQEEVEPNVANGDHHWPRVEWNDANELVDKWHDLEIKAFDPGDPSMNPDEDTLTDNKDFWREQVDSASMDLEVELTVRIRKIALQTMKEFSEKLINGDYA